MRVLMSYSYLQLVTGQPVAVATAGSSRFDRQHSVSNECELTVTAGCQMMTPRLWAVSWTRETQ